ncbi:MAG TPA: hypothetical protein VEK33_13995 [Terriglobales bacterium]|nr:hypothetical protein [Terriglobales bacterium]
MGKRCWYAWVLSGLAAALGAVAQNNSIINQQQPIGSSLHGRHAWIVIGGPDRLNMTGIATEDLKGFDRALALQATSEQVTAYDAMVRSTETAMDQLQMLQEQAGKGNSSSQFSSTAHALGQALEKARSQNKQFLASFSKPQQSGLRELTLKVVKAESDLAQQSNWVDQEVGEANPDVRQIASGVKSLDQALTNFYNQQFTLGKGMGIEDVMGGGDLSLSLPPAKTQINVEKQPIAVTVDGTIAKVADEGHNQFQLELAADVSGLQQNISGLLSSKLNKSERCGEQVVVQGASLTAQAPASLVVTQLHVARWTCFGSLGLASPNELAEGNGTIELKLTPRVDQGRKLRIVPQVDRVEADSFVGEQLRSGSLGTALREETTGLLSSTLESERYFQAILPSVVPDYTVIEKVEFREAGGLRVVLDGTIQISDEQIKLLVNELRNRMSAQDGLPQ